MGTHDVLDEGGNGGPHSSDIPQEAQGIGITPEIFQRIKEAGQEENFRRDLQAAISNPEQKSRFDLLYKVGYEQIIKYKDSDGTEKTMSFIKLTSLGAEGGKIVNQLSNSWKKKFHKFNEELSNQNSGVIDNEYTSQNNENNERKNRVMEIVKNIQSINGIIEPDIDNIRKGAKNVPELQDAKIEDIDQGKYDYILLADFYEKNASRLGSDIKNPTERAKFDNSITNLRLMLGRPVPIQSLTKNIGLGPNRDQVESRGQALIERGYHPNVVWNAEKRTITFENDRGEQYVIDTAPIPPRERVVKHGLSIDQVIPPESKEIQDYKRDRESIQSKISDNRSRVDGLNTRLISVNLDPDKRNPIIQKSREHGTEVLLSQRKELLRQYASTLSVNERTDTIGKLIEINQQLKSKNLSQVIDGINVSSLDNQLEQEYEKLKSLHTELMKLATLSTDLQRHEKKKPEIRDDFESIARKNLDFLISLGYDTIGQATLERVITALNREYRGHIDNSDFISLGSQTLQKDQKKALLIGLTRLMHTSGRGLMPEWDKVNNDDHEIAYRQTDSPIWRESLVSLGKREEYKRLLAHPDITGFQDRIVGRTKPDGQESGT